MRDHTGTQRGVPRIDGYLAIEDYGVIGDGGALALVGRDGSIDWMCLPQLDSPSVFAALLDPERGGRFVLQPTTQFAAEHHYIERTNVLETVFETESGVVKVTDALTIDSSQRGPWRELVREVEGLSGGVTLRWQLDPRPDYGRSNPDITTHRTATVIRGGDIQIALRTWDAGAANVTESGVGAMFEIGEGESATIVMLATGAQPLPVPGRDAVRRRMRETVDVWRSWVARHSYDGPWREAVERSLLAIKLLSDHRTGAIAAAGTTSLPEVLGGERNYDYRFGWVRDLCFTLDALLEVGMDELTEAAITWVLEATARTHPRIDPVYALGGTVVRDQDKLPLAGYRRTGPVHLGNVAGSQLQLGGFGDLIETISKYVSAGHLLGPAAGERLADTADLLTQIWRKQDSGLWELGERADYGTSKLSVWVAFTRITELAEDGHVPPRHLDRWRHARDEVTEFIEQHLFSDSKNAYLFKAGSEDLDCGMLLAARREFGDSARIIGTIDAISQELSAGGPLLYRYSGMQESENAFLACSFWMVEALALSGRLDRAAELMDELIALSSRLGLYSEEMDPSARAMLGNFPQALTHLSLISAAVACVRAQTSSSATGVRSRTQSGGSPSRR
jgi:GH15 family glucan-1,4-alpha-glucosidase